MAYIFGQATVPTSGVVPLFPLPAGLCNVTFWNVATGTVYIGSSTSVTTSNGLQCHSIPTTLFSYVSSGGTMIYGVSNGTGATVQYAIVTDQKL